ncbi:hypothetical protein [Allobranchiibius sp. GilTou73]|uniref:hypothetical protein n=1 Tax=Allobranchiibius sp. GilTou73 TaxID=2904523 RepID=UPI001F36B424|nr:hypothetical protein [Allobranchiibius sp. GilTou73]UIJ35085.1 hypothetical protein LVQ62_01345 [Allobranchiibius sp. GilTou73]
MPVGLAYSNLSDDFGYLQEAGVPPGANPASYKARLVTSQNFCSDAFDVEPDSGSEAAAKYLAVRQNTPPILKAINAALGTHFVLPPAPE